MRYRFSESSSLSFSPKCIAKILGSRARARDRRTARTSCTVVPREFRAISRPLTPLFYAVRATRSENNMAARAVQCRARPALPASADTVKERLESSSKQPTKRSEDRKSFLYWSGDSVLVFEFLSC